MALQIANPIVVGKVERLAKATGLSKTAVVEKAVDRLPWPSVPLCRRRWGWRFVKPLTHLIVDINMINIHCRSKGRKGQHPHGRGCSCKMQDLTQCCSLKRVHPEPVEGCMGLSEQH